MTSPTADGQGWRPIETAPKDQRILVCGMKRLDYAIARLRDRDGWEMELTHDWQGIYGRSASRRANYFRAKGYRV